MKVNEAIFRDYDIRGIVNEDLNTDFARVFGKAYGTFLIRKGTKETVVGYDARQSSPSYYVACIQGLISTGVNVIKIGMVTSPMMYWARKYYKVDGGLAITASHNPPEYNGFKPCGGNGAMFGEGLQKLKRLMMDEDFETGKGEVSEKNIFNDYVSDIASKVKISKKLKIIADVSRRVSLARPRLARLKVIVDCGNSTAGPFAPALLEKLGVEVVKLFCDIDFTQPNHPPDPQNPKAYPQIQEKIRSGSYDAGILFDGDADRLGVVDHEGTIIWGDQTTALCARKILEDKPNSLILYELQCSKSATDDTEARGGKVKLIRVGHSYIEEALFRYKAELAGEISGHIFFADRWYGFDDAMYAACRLLEYLAETGKTLKELADSLPKYVAVPLTRTFAPEDRKFAIVEELKKYFAEKGEKVITIDGVRLEWDYGWAVIRASNTQPQLTMRVEATTGERLEEIKKLVEEALVPYEKEGVKVEWGKVH